MSDQSRLTDCKARCAELRDALEDMWWQFAYQTEDGKRWNGGLSALEHCEGVLADKPNVIPVETHNDDKLWPRQAIGYIAGQHVTGTTLDDGE